MNHWLFLRFILNRFSALILTARLQMRLTMVLSTMALLVLPKIGHAHAFDERYDLPIPLSFFIWGAVLTVAFTYLLSILFFRESGSSQSCIAEPKNSQRFLFSISPRQQSLIKLVAVFGLGLLIALAFFGPDNPLMNITPHFVWVNWWIGIPLLFALFGSVVHFIDPFAAIGSLQKKRSSPYVEWPVAKALERLGRWPAVVGLLCWCWIEVVYPNAALPHHLGVLAIIWLMSGFLGRSILGKQDWNEGWDFFGIYFANFGLISPFCFFAGSLYIGMPFIRLIEHPKLIRGSVAFIVAMLSTVLFDGLHSSPVWLSFQQLFQGKFDVNGYFLGFLGLTLVWASFYFVFLGSCLLIPRNEDSKSKNIFLDAFYIAEVFAPTLIPIALAYHMAHNFSSLVIQGQDIIALASDPLGMGWNLFGTANFYPNIAVLDAKTVWYMALSAIVIGHVVSIYLAHLVALREFKTAALASRAALPLTLLMIGFTAISLLILAQPLTN